MNRLLNAQQINLKISLLEKKQHTYAYLFNFFFSAYSITDLKTTYNKHFEGKLLKLDSRVLSSNLFKKKKLNNFLNYSLKSDIIYCSFNNFFFVLKNFLFIIEEFKSFFFLTILLKNKTFNFLEFLKFLDFF